MNGRQSRTQGITVHGWTGDSNDAGLTERDGNGQVDGKVGRNYGSGREEGVDNWGTLQGWR
jgi:hypothetical protein